MFIFYLKCFFLWIIFVFKTLIEIFYKIFFGYLIVGIILKEFVRCLFKIWFIRIYICKDFIDFSVNGILGRNFVWVNIVELGFKWINLVFICNIDW